MTLNSKPLRLYIVLGENSGDALGAQLLNEFRKRDVELEVAGLAGPKMIELGYSSVFDISETSVMGFADVVPRLPNIIRRINQVTSDALKYDPDILLLIDSPEFTQAIAKKFRKKNKTTKIVKYVCPSIWFWRPGRAKTMNDYIDHIMALLPFEPGELAKLEGPPSSFVGHPLLDDKKRFQHGDKSIVAEPPKILILPGSRAGEIKRMLPVMETVIRELEKNSFSASFVIPTVPHLVETVRETTRNWSKMPEIISEQQDKDKAFRTADSALACSGTVMLELALFDIPTISIYKLDKIGMLMRHFVSGWTANLPNLIADDVVIPELFNEYVIPKRIARMLEKITVSGPTRDAQLLGFQNMRAKMLGKTIHKRSPVDVILEIAAEKNN